MKFVTFQADFKPCRNEGKFQRVDLNDKLLNFTLSHDRHKVVICFIEAILFSAIGDIL